MSTYTELYLIPEAPTWKPPLTMLRHILLFFGPIKVVAASAHREPIEWDRVPDDELTLEEPSLEEALELAYSKEWVCVGIVLNCKQWWKRIGACADTIPDRLSEGLVPDNVYVQVGPASIPDPLGESMAARPRSHWRSAATACPRT